MSDLLTEVVEGRHGCFALVCRDGVTLEVLIGRELRVESVSDIPVPDQPEGPAVIAVVPYRQIVERGFSAHDDQAGLICLIVEQSQCVALEQAMPCLPIGELTLHDAGFTCPDSEYAQVVESIVTDEIANGAGANFVVRRDFRAQLSGDHAEAAITILRRLLHQEVGAYWTFAFVTPSMALVGATPERHVSVQAGTVMMNPISGTFRHPGRVPDREEILEFLRDPKETDELFMVVDEELKMMAAICDRGGQVLGPDLKQMGNLTHTEYLLRGRSTLDVRDILRATMFAPTVTGSPIENAARVIHRYEPDGRGYYAGVIALLGHDGHGQTLDAPILIRTCELGADGRLKASVGATLVRASVPQDEVAETHAKLSGVLQALGVIARHRAQGSPPAVLAERPEIAEALQARNHCLAGFWIDRQPHPTPAVRQCTAVIVDCEDEWAAMLAHQLRHLGISVDVRRWNEVTGEIEADLLVMGPGPGDPTCLSDPRMATIQLLIKQRLAAGRALLAICLSHQLLAAQLGMSLTRLTTPNQGSQREIELFGHKRTVGFYNSFTALATGAPPQLELSCDARTQEVYALRGPGFASVQFHPESVLTTDGIEILQQLVGHALCAGETRAITT